MEITAIDRTKSPLTELSSSFEFIKAKEIRLDNGIPFYYVNAGEQELSKIELIFPAGTFHEKQRLAATSTIELLDEGTAHHSSSEIASFFDFYGSSLQVESTADFASVSLFSLNKFLPHLLPLLVEILTEPVFPENELEIFKTLGRQRLSVDNNKVDYVVRKTFNQSLFGKDHPYGYYQNQEDYFRISRDHLVYFHRSCYNWNDCKIIASGKISEVEIKLINEQFGKLKSQSREGTGQKVNQQPFKSEKIYIEKPDALQSAVRMGKRMFNKTHPDYKKLLILNTVLGGYFGSRLMSNIREEKGYTYGIGSAMVSFLHDGYFFVATEAGADVTNAVLDEIYKEINRLSTDEIPAEELHLVKNYMMGSFMRSIDGPFNLADRFKGILLYNMGYEYYEDYLKVITETGSKELKNLAVNYFSTNDLTEVVVGKK